MPELPEVETIKRGLIPLIGLKLTSSIVRFAKLRYLVDAQLLTKIQGKTLLQIIRRAKYIVLVFEENYYIIIHLGMSGRISVLNSDKEIVKHDHVDLVFGQYILRYNDPRRFGCILAGVGDWSQHKLLVNLGPEPLENTFTPEYLLEKASSRTTTLKQLIMDNAVVVGVGNIYACESLFNSRLSPLRIAKTLTLSEAVLLVNEIKKVLNIAIANGGSTLKDYVDASGNMGYFQQQHQVYGRAGLACKICNTAILETRLGQRNSFYCPNCQH